MGEENFTKHAKCILLEDGVEVEAKWQGMENCLIWTNQERTSFTWALKLPSFTSDNFTG